MFFYISLLLPRRKRVLTEVCVLYKDPIILLVYTHSILDSVWFAIPVS
jgi:hypothetical protein